jgi:G3E family GTPase
MICPGVYSGELQVLLSRSPVREQLTIRVETAGTAGPQQMRAAFLAGYEELRSAVDDGLLDLVVEVVDGATFDRTATSGKLRTVVDTRHC